MILNFYYENEEQCKELKNIVLIESKKHFDLFTSFVRCYFDRIEIFINDNAYFNDIESAKQEMYNTGSQYVKDFVSEVQENLSFVPKIDVAGYH